MTRAQIKEIVRHSRARWFEPKSNAPGLPDFILVTRPDWSATNGGIIGIRCEEAKA